MAERSGEREARQQTKALAEHGLHERLESELLSASRAETIAQTETNRAIGAGQLLLWQLMGSSFQFATSVVGKRWRVSADEKTCPICAPLNGKVARLSEAFVGGIDQPPANPRCRCTTELVWRAGALRKPAWQVTDNPCANLASYTERVACYIDELGLFGVSVSSAFTPAQLQAMLNVVNITANRMIEECGLDVAPEEVFYQVFGDVQFRYDPDKDVNVIPPYPVDRQGNRVSAENQYVYFREAGTYLAGAYAAPGVERYFPRACYALLSRCGSLNPTPGPSPNSGRGEKMACDFSPSPLNSGERVGVRGLNSAQSA